MAQGEVLSPANLKNALEEKGYQIELDRGLEPGREDGEVLLPGTGRFRYLVLDSQQEFSNFTQPVLFALTRGGSYYCEECDKHHRMTSDIGREHCTEERLVRHLRKESEKYILAKLVEDQTQLMLHKVDSFPDPTLPIEEVETLEQAEQRIGRKEYREADVKQGEVAFTQVPRLPSTANELGEKPEDFEEEGGHRLKHIAETLLEHTPEVKEGSLMFFKAKADDCIYMAAQAQIVVGHEEHHNAVLKAGVWKIIPHSFVQNNLRSRRPMD